MTGTLNEIREAIEMITLQREILRKQMEGMDVLSAGFMQKYKLYRRLYDEGLALRLEEYQAERTRAINELFRCDQGETEEPGP